MTRRLDLPEEFVFDDGMRIESPSELVRLLKADAKREVEVWGRLDEGELQQWLEQGGWESQARAVAQVRHRGARERLDLFQALMGTLEPEPSGTAQARDDTRGRQAAQWSQPQRSQSSHQSAQPRQEPALASDLITRQRTAVLALVSAGNRWRSSGQAERDRCTKLTSEAQQAARAAQGVVEGHRESVRQAVERARDALRTVELIELSDQWRDDSEFRAVDGDHRDAATALELSVLAAHQHQSKVQAAVRDLQQLREREREAEDRRQRQLEQLREREREEEQRRQQDEAAQLAREEATQDALRTAAALLCLGLFALLVGGYFGVSVLLILLPLAFGIAIAASRADALVNLVTRVLSWGSATQTGARSGWVARIRTLVLGGVQLIERATSGIDDQYVRVGARSAATLYYGGTVVAVALAVAYAVLFVAVILIFVGLVLWILAKVLQK